MSKKFINPFEGYGNIVFGERFVGRENSLKAINARVIKASKPGNLAIIGMPRIGKSSLAWVALMEDIDRLIENNQLPIWIDVGTYNGRIEFFCDIVEKCSEEMDTVGWLTPIMQKFIDLVLDENLSWIKRYNQILKFFESIKKENYKITYILDEFDNARRIFEGSDEGFQKLRAISYSPRYSVSFMTISRRSVKNIEKSLKVGSTFYETFIDNNLIPFDQEELKKYLNKFSKVGITLSYKEINDILHYCGGHPFILDVVCFEIVEIYRTMKKISIDAAVRKVEMSIIDHYDHLIDLLKEDQNLNLLSKLLQVLFGPVVDLTGNDKNILMGYGLIKKDKNNNYITFSKHFESFLTLIHREVDLWPILGQTERSLRQIISKELFRKYGDDWILDFEKNNPRTSKLLDRLRDDQAKDINNFGNRASENLLDYTYPMDLFTLISNEWKDCFEEIFGFDESGKKIPKNHWHQSLAFISKVRNPMAHHRANVIQDYERKLVEAYCEEILDYIQRA